MISLISSHPNTFAFYGDAVFAVGIIVFLVFATVRLLLKPLDVNLQGYRDVMVPWSIVFFAIASSLVMRLKPTI